MSPVKLLSSLCSQLPVPTWKPELLLSDEQSTQDASLLCVLV